MASLRNPLVIVFWFENIAMFVLYGVIDWTVPVLFLKFFPPMYWFHVSIQVLLERRGAKLLGIFFFKQGNVASILKHSWFKNERELVNVTFFHL